LQKNVAEQFDLKSTYVKFPALNSKKSSILSKSIKIQAWYKSPSGNLMEKYFKI